jgi:hypothetical protein
MANDPFVSSADLEGRDSDRGDAGSLAVRNVRAKTGLLPPATVTVCPETEMTQNGSQPNEPAVSGGDRGTASCWSCQAPLARADANCPRCGAETGGVWIECRIEVRREGRHGEFVAALGGEAVETLAGRSEPFRWFAPGDEPPRTRATEARLAELYRTLRHHGWQRKGSGQPDPWYQFSFHALIAPPADEIGVEPQSGPAVESVADVAFVPEEPRVESDEVATEESPAAASEALAESPPRPLEIPPTGKPRPIAAAPSDEPERPVAVPSNDDSSEAWYRPDVVDPIARPAVESQLLTRIDAYSVKPG